MNILLASSSSGSRGGGELYLLYLGRALVQRGHRVSLWASSHARMDELSNSFSSFGDVTRARYKNTYDHAARPLSTTYNLVKSREIAAEWKRLKPDCIHVNKQNLEDGLDLLRASNASGLPSVCTIHLTQSARYLKARFGRARDVIARKSLERYAGLLVAVVESRGRDMEDFLGLERGSAHVIPNGVPIFDLARRDAARRPKREALRLSGEEFLILAVGRMVPQKRPLLFLELAERIHRRMPKARFLWVGDGRLSGDWDAFVRKHSLEEVIHRSPWQLDILPFLAAADLFLHTAEYEGLPLALLEALSAGLPCALTENLPREMPFLEAIHPVVAGPGEAWIPLLGDAVQLRRSGQAGRQLVEKRFSFDRMAESYEALYNSVVS